MQEFTFKYDTLYFRVHANDDTDAVNRARRALEESFPEKVHDYLKIELTGGAFDGRLYIEPGEISRANIIKREQLKELAADIPF